MGLASRARSSGNAPRQPSASRSMRKGWCSNARYTSQRQVHHPTPVPGLFCGGLQHSPHLEALGVFHCSSNASSFPRNSEFHLTCDPLAPRTHGKVASSFFSAGRLGSGVLEVGGLQAHTPRRCEYRVQGKRHAGVETRSPGHPRGEAGYRSFGCSDSPPGYNKRWRRYLSEGRAVQQARWGVHTLER